MDCASHKNASALNARLLALIKRLGRAGATWWNTDSMGLRCRIQTTFQLLGYSFTIGVCGLLALATTGHSPDCRAHPRCLVGCL